MTFRHQQFPFPSILHRKKSNSMPTPPFFGQCFLWCTAKNPLNGPLPNDGDPVELYDFSQSERHMTNEFVEARPIWHPDIGPGGGPIVEFNFSQSLFNSTTIEAEEYTIFIVGKFPFADGEYKIPYYDGNPVTGGFGFYMTDDGGGNLYRNILHGPGTIKTNGALPGSDFEIHGIGGKQTGSENSFLMVNYVSEEITDREIGYFPNTLGTTQIILNRNIGATFQFCEIVVYYTLFSQEDAFAISDYLLQQWPIFG